MSDVDQDQKTETASDKRMGEAMERGQFAKAPEMQVIFILLAAFGGLAFTVNEISRDVTELSIGIFSQLATLHLQLDSAPTQVGQMVVSVGKMLLPILGACSLAAIVAGGLQTGFHVTPKVFSLNFSNLNPMSGFSRIFSKSAFTRAGIEMLKLVAVGFTLWGGFRTLMHDTMFSAPVEAAYLGDFIYRTTLTFLSRILMALSVIGGISYGYEFFKTKRDLMMSREEVKEERRSSEGDAHVKGAMKRMARRIFQKQMLSAVATADVVITNPTHYAVALKYERGTDKAPVVLAKGENQFARRIKALAAEHGVPMVENKPVARMLYAVGKVGEAIPNELYQTVAEILAMVYRTHRYYFYRLRSRRAELN